MFKRRDWRMFNRDDGNSSSDSDSDIENDGRGALDESDDDGSASSSSSESGSEIESGSGSEGEDEGAAGDDSDSEEEEEDDDEAAGDDSDESASEETPTVLTRATDEREAGADAPEEDQPSKSTDPSKGIAVKCSVCPGVLCLSEKSLQQHLDSKRHKKAMAKQGVGVDDEDVLVDAAAAGRKARAREAANRRADGDESDSLEGYSDGEAETHAERLARLRAQKVFARDAPVVDSDDEDGGANNNRREKRGGGRQRQRARATRDADPRGAKKGKPGKRQREAAKAAAASAAALKNAKDEGEPMRKRGHDTLDTRPRGNRAAKRAAEAAATAAAKPAKRGAYDFDAGDLLAPKPTVDKMRGDLRQMKSGRGGAGRGASAGGRGGRGRGKGIRGRGRY